MATDERSIVDVKIDEAVASLTLNGRKDVVLKEEAERVIRLVRNQEPEALLEWFQEHMVAFVRERLQLRLGAARSASRAGVFGRTSPDHEAIAPVNPFSRRYAVAGDVWRKVGDMTRPDWNYLIENRSVAARASLFEVALAKQIVKRMPDDVTPTSAVTTPEEFEQLEKLAFKRAEKGITDFRK